MRTIVIMTRHTNVARTPLVSYPHESIGGRYQHVWSLTQREAWLRGRAERLRMLNTPARRYYDADPLNIRSGFWD